MYLWFIVKCIVLIRYDGAKKRKGLKEGACYTNIITHIIFKGFAAS